MSASALLIIDMQRALVSGAHDEEAVVARIAALADRARAARWPVIYMQHNHASHAPMMRGSSGWEIDARLAPRAGDVVIEKTASDAFYDTTLEATLKELSVDSLVVTGMMTEYCVDATCRSALSHAFDVVLVGDGHTTGDSGLPAESIIAHHNAILANLAHPTHQITVSMSSQIQT